VSHRAVETNRSQQDTEKAEARRKFRNQTVAAEGPLVRLFQAPHLVGNVRLEDGFDRGAKANRPNGALDLSIVSETATPDPLKEDFCGFGTHLTCLGAVWNGVMTPLPTLGGNNAMAILSNKSPKLLRRNAK
jgi:hypothetical protein